MGLGQKGRRELQRDVPSGDVPQMTDVSVSNKSVSECVRSS